MSILDQIQDQPHSEKMELPQRDMHGPIKRYGRYFTIPINSVMFKQLNDIKWRTHIEKTEATRRLLEYFLDLPPEAQDKILHSFDKQRAQQWEKLKDARREGKKQKVKTFMYRKRNDQLMYDESLRAKLPPEEVVVVKQEAPQLRIVKRSGLP